MKLKYITTLLASLMASASFAATVNIQFSQGANAATGFASADGLVLNGLVWGIIVSTSNTSFTDLPADFVLSTSLNGKLISTSDDYYIGSTVLTATGATGDTNPGKINVLNSIQMNVPATNAIVEGNRFALVWFDTSVTSTTATLAGGNKYGLLTDASFTIPAAGATRNVSTFFSASPDPIKPANTITVAPVPETSTSLLGALGALALLRRRRN